MYTFIIGIQHDHDGDLGVTIGEVEATDETDAFLQSASWVNDKKDELSCSSYGDNCEVQIRKLVPSFKSMVLLTQAEKIVV